ncbi:hypothetical protein DSL72_005819 [Monilinia vaccinii-corymbosi]|uniref:GED domain-containing protein n=1 Tax=Monilinia vaccinii-corymbosi TaxID=61207 RepID=A0A8A3PGQ6_9HELO|nr:hypothetical protein DSL72_005819 [Monilinia vaccinii-corymbosi]
MQNLNLLFSQDITTLGHFREIGDPDEEGPSYRKADGNRSSVVPSIVTRDQFITHVEFLMPRTRARELPGTFNPMIVADLFREQSQPWGKLARDHINAVWKAISDFIEHAIEHITDEAASSALLAIIFRPALKKMMADLNDKANELLRPHQSSHPITYSNNFVNTLQEIRRTRHSAEMAEVVRSFFVMSSKEMIYRTQKDEAIDLNRLVRKPAARAEPDIIRFSCSEALDYMRAYYDVALERFIDDMSVEVIEEKLVMPLAEIFSPNTVIDMSEEMVTQIAGEPENSRAERAQLNRQKAVLAKGFAMCMKFDAVRRSVIGGVEMTNGIDGTDGQ